MLGLRPWLKYEFEIVVNLLFSDLMGLREPLLPFGLAPELELSVYICVR